MEVRQVHCDSVGDPPGMKADAARLLYNTWEFREERAFCAARPHLVPLHSRDWDGTMRNMFDRSTRIGMLFAGTLVCAHAQWLNHPDPRMPRTKDGKPNLTAPVRRLDGHPDLSGLWQANRTPEG